MSATDAQRNGAAVIRGYGEVVGVAQRRALVKIAQLPELAIIDGKTVLNDVELRSHQNPDLILSGLVGKIVDLVAEFVDGGWVCTTASEAGAGPPTEVPKNELPVNQDPVMPIPNLLTTPAPRPAVMPPPPLPRPVVAPRAPLLPPPPPPRRNLISQSELRQPQTQTLQRSIGVILATQPTYGYIRSLTHGRVFFPACTLRSRFVHQFRPNYAPGTVVQYSAENTTRPPGRVPARSWVARHVSAISPHNFQPGTVISGFGAICDVDSLCYGYIRTSACDYKVFFPRTNVALPLGGVLPMRVPMSSLLGEKVRFIAFYAGGSRIRDLRTPYVGLYVQLYRLRVPLPIQNVSQARSRSTSTSSNTSSEPSGPHSAGIRRVRSLGYLASRDPPNLSAEAIDNRIWSARRRMYASESVNLARSQCQTAQHVPTNDRLSSSPRSLSQADDFDSQSDHEGAGPRVRSVRFREGGDAHAARIRSKSVERLRETGTLPPCIKPTVSNGPPEMSQSYQDLTDLVGLCDTATANTSAPETSEGIVEVITGDLIDLNLG